MFYQGTPQADHLLGGTGWDSLEGLAGNDTLDGGEGNDTLDGGPGDDRLLAGPGLDLSIGGDGTDTLVLHGNRSDYVVFYYGWFGELRLVDTVLGRDWVEVSVFDVEKFKFADGTATWNDLVFQSGGGYHAWPNDTSYTGTAANEEIRGHGNETLDGGAGNDWIEGYGSSVLIGGAGNDYLFGYAAGQNVLGGDNSVAVYTGLASEYDVSLGEEGTLRISDRIASRDGTDLIDVAKLRFSDKVLTKAGLLQQLQNPQGADVVAPVFAGGTPGDNAQGIFIGSKLKLSFSEPVTAGMGDIQVIRSDGVVVKTIPVTNNNLVTFSGTTVTIDPSDSLYYDSAYHLAMAPGVIIDVNGNPFAGFQGYGSYNFTTDDRPDSMPAFSNLPPNVAVGGAPVTGTISYEFDQDWFLVPLFAGQTYFFEAVASDPAADMYMALLLPEGNLVAGRHDSDGFDVSEVFHTATTTGNYRLEAAEWNHKLASYSIAVMPATVANGTGGMDTLTGSGQSDLLRGLQGDDLLRGNGGIDRLDGGAGIDTAVLAGSHSNYVVRQGPTAAMVSSLSGDTVQQTLTQVERVRFDDGQLALDLTGNAGIAAKTMGAVFGAWSLGYANYVGYALSIVDHGASYESLVQLALDIRFGPNATHADIVTGVYANLVGQAPDAATLASLVNLIDGGTFTPAGLCVLAADHPQNAANVDLVGLKLHGLEYV